MFIWNERCEECAKLERIHQLKTNEYLALLDEQSRALRGGSCLAANHFDPAIQKAKRERLGALDAVIRHEKTHAPRRAAFSLV